MKCWMIVCMLLLASCSLTRRLASDEVLYRGVKRIKIETPPDVRLSPQMRSDLYGALRLTTDNVSQLPFKSPFPMGLWIWNWESSGNKGVKSWIRDKWGKAPVLLSDVRPEVRLKMAEQVARNYGFFKAKGDYRIHYKRNPQKAKISYRMELPVPYKIDTVISTVSIAPEISLQTLEKGSQYDVGKLTALREDVSASLRNTGYFYFQPSYLEYWVDTAVGHSQVAVTMSLKPETPPQALNPYSIRRINIHLDARQMPRDTLSCGGISLTRPLPAYLRAETVVNAIKMHPESLYSEIEQRQTQAALGRLGVFKFSSMQFVEVDSAERRRELDVNVLADYAPPITLDAELSVASASNDLMGPGLSLSISNRNLFKRANNLTLRLNGSYEWQIGGGNRTLVDSYDLGINFGLSFPRLLFSERAVVDNAYPHRTHLVTGLEWQARSGYFRMLSWRSQMSWEFSSSLRNKHIITPLRATYSFLQATSPRFDSTLVANPTLALSFRDRFTLSSLYSFSHAVGEYGQNGMVYQFSVSEAGNLLSAIRLALGKDVPGGRFMGIRYSQFLRGEGAFIIHRKLSPNTMLAFRLLGGIGWAYGNSDVLPYAEQFYIGGANSLRAFRIRSIGPGSYRPTVETFTSYIDRTGEIKLEANLGYRFVIYGRWHGAVFADAGNVWLLKTDASRPGGQFRWQDVWRETALGTGCGIRYDLTFLVFRVDLGVALHAPYDTGKSGYFNIPAYNFNDGLLLNVAVGYPF